MIIDVEYNEVKKEVKKAPRKAINKEIKKEVIQSTIHIIRALKWFTVGLIGIVGIAVIVGFIQGITK